MNGKTNRQRFGHWFVACVAALMATFAQAAIWHVDANAPTSGQTGTSWDHPYVTIQQAIAVAQSGDHILVAGGTYKPSGQTSPINLVSEVSIQGGYEGYGSQTPDARTEESVLSGDLNGNDDPGTPSTYTDNAHGVVFIPDGVQPPTQSGDFADRANLDGFTITAAHHRAGLYTNLNVSTATSAVIRNCKIHNNVTTTAIATPDGGGGKSGQFRLSAPFRP